MARTASAIFTGIGISTSVLGVILCLTAPERDYTEAIAWVLVTICLFVFLLEDLAGPPEADVENNPSSESK